MMKFFPALALVLIFDAACAQSNLPACPPSGYFHNCFTNYTLANGEKYVGEFSYDKFNGQGTFTYLNGAKYVGEWKDSSFNGQGTYINALGAVVRQGLWANGRFISSTPVQQEIVPNQENNRVIPEVEEAKRKQAELEQQLRIAQQQVSSSLQDQKKSAPTENERLSLEASKRKCTELGFKPATEGYGKCVLQLSK
jgi:hypothetical protein